MEPREREATRRRAGVVGGVGVGERPAVGGGVGAGGGLTPGTVCGVGEQRRGSFRMLGGDGRGLPGGRGTSHAGDQRPVTPQHRCSATTAAVGHNTTQHSDPPTKQHRWVLARFSAHPGDQLPAPLLSSRGHFRRSLSTCCPQLAPAPSLSGGTQAARHAHLHPLGGVLHVLQGPCVPHTSLFSSFSSHLVSLTSVIQAVTADGAQGQDLPQLVSGARAPHLQQCLGRSPSHSTWVENK